MKVRFLVSFALAAACTPAPTRSTATPAPSLPVPAAKAAPDGGAPPDVHSLVCADRPNCRIRNRRSAGFDASGQRLVVLTADLGIERLSEASSTDDREADPDLVEEPSGDMTGARQGSCHRFEYWLVAEGSGASPQKLVAVCNDGYGASGVGQDLVEVGENFFSFGTNGGSAWRWGTTDVLSLSPLRHVSHSWDGMWTMGSHTDEGMWNWVAFEGWSEWFSPRCNPDGTAPANPERERAHGYRSRLLPRVTLDDAFRESGFRSTSLGTCALRLDGAGSDKTLTFGKPIDAKELSVRAVLSSHEELFVEVRDARPSGASSADKAWFTGDHLELWLTDDRGSYDAMCLEKRAPPRQWGIRVGDGRVFAGYGKPDPRGITVERAAPGDGSVRFKIGLPPPAREGTRGITIGYSDGDGKKQLRVIASSAVSKDRPETLGGIFDVTPKTAVCRTVNGKLEPVMTKAAVPSEAFLEPNGD